MIDVDKDWRAEEDMRTLMRAEEIKADKERMAKAQKCAAKQMSAMKKVASKKGKGESRAHEMMEKGYR